MKMDSMGLMRQLKRCGEVAEEMLDIAFRGSWNNVREQDMGHDNNEALAKMFFLQGANSMQAFLVGAWMPEPMLDY